MSASMKWCHLGHGLKWGLPTRRDSGPTRYECVPHLTDMVSLKVSCLFVHCMVCIRRRQDSLGIVGSSAVRSWDRQGEKPCVSCLRRSESSAQVRQHNSYTSYSQGYCEKIPMAQRPKLFVVRWGRQSRCLLIECERIGAKACLSRSNAIHSRYTKLSSSPNCR